MGDTKPKYNEEDEMTTISISKRTRDRINDRGCRGETYDTIINRTFDEADKRK